jgi:hypothetical protein
VAPNGPLLGTCVTTKAGMKVSYRVGSPKHFIHCTSDGDCNETGATCQKGQGDCNANGVGDACECYANFNYDTTNPHDLRVNTSDLSILKNDFGRIDCSESNPCYADGNGDNRVNTSDLSLLKNEYGRIDCPALP